LGKRAGDNGIYIRNAEVYFYGFFQSGALLLR